MASVPCRPQASLGTGVAVGAGVAISRSACGVGVWGRITVAEVFVPHPTSVPPRTTIVTKAAILCNLIMKKPRQIAENSSDSAPPKDGSPYRGAGQESKRRRCPAPGDRRELCRGGCESENARAAFHA